MLIQFVIGFVVLVAASYLGTTMALRGFFGREYFDPSGRSGSNGPPSGDGSDGPPRSESPRGQDSRRDDRPDDRTRTDDVPRAGDVVSDESEGG